MSLDVFIRSGGEYTVKFFLLPGHMTQSKSLCQLEHMRKSGKKAGKSGGEQRFGVVGVAQPLQGTPNLNRHLVGGLSSLLKPSNFQTFAVRKEGAHGWRSYLMLQLAFVTPAA